MPGFNASTVIKPLDYTLRPYVDKESVVKEPSDVQLDAFEKAMVREQQRLRKLIPDLPDGDDLDEYQAVLEKAENARVSPEATKTWKIQAGIFAALCSGEPSEAEIMTLPRRVRLHFFKWLREELASPEAAAGDGEETAQVLNLPSAAAG
jgi:hypothetical protein